MRLSIKGTIAVLALGIAAGSLLPAASFSQALQGPATERERDLYERIKVLQSKLLAQNARSDSLEAKVAAQQRATDGAITLINARPKGYTKAFITIGNLSRLPHSDGISYWARQ